MVQRVDAAGRAFITREEGEVLKAYKDSVGVWTIGVGHTSDEKYTVKPGQTISHETSQQLLNYDLNEVEKAIDTYVKVPLTQNQRNAIASLAFNIGVGGFKKSTLLKDINAGRMDRVTQDFAAWNKAGGKPNKSLTARRAREAALFMTDSPTPLETPKAAAPSNNPITQSPTGQSAAVIVAAGGLTTVSAVIKQAQDVAAQAHQLKDTGWFDAIFANNYAMMAVGAGIIIAAGYIIWRKYNTLKDSNGVA